MKLTNKLHLTVDRPLDGKVVIVTGASSGIGAAISRILAGAGARVAMAARREEKLEEQKRKIEEDGGIAICVKCDVTDRQMVCLDIGHDFLTIHDKYQFRIQTYK